MSSFYYNADMEDKLRMIKFLGQYLAASRSDQQILEMAMIISQYVLGYDHAMIRALENEKLLARKWIGFPREAADLNIGLGDGVCARLPSLPAQSWWKTR